MTAAIGWDDARTASAYERFCRRHARYRAANDALAAHAELGAGHQVLDVAAGTGRTAETVLPYVGAHGRVLAVEPAHAMRTAGARRLDDPRVSWADALPDDDARFDRIVCGAGIWQLLPLDATLARLAALLVPGGALAFNIPASYLLEPDRPGGGKDPYLVGLVAAVECSPTQEHEHTIIAPPRSADEIDRALGAAGFRAERWSFELRLTQAAYRDWLKIPPVSEGFLAGVPPGERARRLDEAYRRADRRSWKWERWVGWTAWLTS